MNDLFAFLKLKIFHFGNQLDRRFEKKDIFLKKAQNGNLAQQYVCFRVLELYIKSCENGKVTAIYALTGDFNLLQKLTIFSRKNDVPAIHCIFDLIITLIQ